MKESYDAIIIGAGVIGAAITLELARKGLKSICVDKVGEAGHGSTAGSCALIRPFYSTLDGAAIAWESHYYWLKWAEHLGVEDERGLIRYVNCGNLVFKSELNNNMVPVMSILDQLGCPYDELSMDEVVARYPFVSRSSFAPVRKLDDPDFGSPNGEELDGAVFFPHGGYVTDPALSAHNLLRAAEAAGATFRLNTKVTAICKAQGRVSGVKIDGGQEIVAPVVVNVAGPHSFKINAMAGVEDDMAIKTRALRHEVAHVPSPIGLDFETHGGHLSDSDTSVYCRPESGNHILIGSEDPECDERIWVDPDDFDRSFSNQWQLQVMRLAQRIPELKIPTKLKGVVELYDVSDDWIPIYDKSGLPGFYMAIGTSGNQFKNAPIVGEMMADLITTCETGHDHDANPVTFHLKNIDRTISMGFYSRKREVNQQSSFSVRG